MKRPSTGRRWPRRIALIGFAFAALSGFYGFTGLTSSYQPGVAFWVRPVNSVPFFLAMLLVIGLIELLRQRPAGPRLCVLWSYLFVLWSLATMTVNYWHALNL